MVKSLIMNPITKDIIVSILYINKAKNVWNDLKV
jgi:hypothetical protein